jgi:nucleoside-diphosphate-sugar epimerase
MSGQILIIGAAGRFGRAAAEAFRSAEWSVTSLVRPGGRARAPRGTRVIEADALDQAAVTDAARGVDIVLHASNPPYTQWARLALPLAYAAIEAAETAGATLMFPGNVYNYATDMPALLDETTPMRPDTRKGQIRVTIEQRMREASERGMRAIILRAGDFFGGGLGSWFDLVIAKDVGKNRVTYPGPPDIMHAWAYLPDMAEAMVRIASVRSKLGPFETFGFPGHAVTGRELVAAISHAVGREMQVKSMSWWLIRLLRPILSMSSELAEMEYLWRVPHRISGAKLQAAIGDIPETPFGRAIASALRELKAIP